MNVQLTIHNRQRTRAVDLRRLRQVVRGLFRELTEITQAELGVTLVGVAEMTRVNEAYLGHLGSTDVITFDYAESQSNLPRKQNLLHGEIFVCIEEAISQARRFRTTWPSEVVRYVVHGVLHLCGYDDHSMADRRRMKREEDRLVRSLANRFALNRLSRKTRLQP